MQGYGLARGLSFCLIGGQAVFLDLRQDQYFRLAAPESEALELVMAGADPPDDALKLLECAGLVEQQDRAKRVAATRIARPSCSLLEDSQPVPPRAGTAIRIALDLAMIRRRLQRGRLAELVDKAACAAPRGATDEAALAHEALGFAAARQWVPLEPNCLLDSLALRFHLLRRGLAATLVMGVKLDPFAAHAWVQHGDMILNDCLDGPLDFTPIAAV